MSLPAILEDNIACVEQASELLAQIGADGYTHRHPAFFDSSVGGHVRHSVDHYTNFFRGLPTRRIDYESRERDPALEADPSAARDALQAVATRLAALSSTDIEAGCSVRVNTHTDDATDPHQWSGSTIRRELQFLLGHAIHHHAQVSAMVRTLGIEPPEGFGTAFRETAFARILDPTRFHAFHDPAHPAHSPIMSRPDSRTVSLLHVEASQDAVTHHYSEPSSSRAAELIGPARSVTLELR